MSRPSNNFNNKKEIITRKSDLIGVLLLILSSWKKYPSCCGVSCFRIFFNPSGLVYEQTNSNSPVKKSMTQS